VAAGSRGVRSIRPAWPTALYIRPGVLSEARAWLPVPVKRNCQATGKCGSRIITSHSRSGQVGSGQVLSLYTASGSATTQCLHSFAASFTPSPIQAYKGYWNIKDVNAFIIVDHPRSVVYIFGRFCLPVYVCLSVRWQLSKLSLTYCISGSLYLQAIRTGHWIKIRVT